MQSKWWTFQSGKLVCMCFCVCVCLRVWRPVMWQEGTLLLLLLNHSKDNCKTRSHTDSRHRNRGKNSRGKFNLSPFAFMSAGLLSYFELPKSTLTHRHILAYIHTHTYTHTHRKMHAKLWAVEHTLFKGKIWAFNLLRTLQSQSIFSYCIQGKIEIREMARKGGEKVLKFTQWSLFARWNRSSCMQVKK